MINKRIFAEICCGLILALQPGVLALPVSADSPDVISADSSVDLDFPNSLTFNLEATAETPIDRVELLYEIEGLDTTEMATIDVDATEHIDVEREVDAQINYIVPGVEIEYYWQLVDENNDVVQTESHEFLWYDDAFAWDSYEEPDVIVYSYSDDIEFNKEAARLAQTSVDRFKDLYSIEEVSPVRIWVYETRSDFDRILRANSEEWIGGVSMPQSRVIALPLPTGDTGEMNRVIPHEISHHVLYQATENPFNFTPTWFDEGLAVYGQLAGNQNDQEQVVDAYLDDRLPTLQTLISGFPSDSAASNISYAASHMIVKFIIDTYGVQAIRDICAIYRTGVTHDEALFATIGVDTAGLNQLWRDSIAVAAAD